MTAKRQPRPARPDAGRDMNDAARAGVPPEAIADAVDQAREVMGDAPPPAPPPEPQDDDGGYAGRPGSVDADLCPIQFLGHDRGKFYIADIQGGVQATGSFSPVEIEKLFFGELGWLIDNFPTKARGRELYSPQIFRAWAMAQCARAGWFDPGQHVRGPGCWTDGAAPDLRGNLVLHRGFDVWHITQADDGSGMRWQQHRPGCRIGQYVYPRIEGVNVTLSDTPLTDEQYAALLHLIGDVTWSDPKREAPIYLGALGISFLTGALPHRPGCFITTAFGGGKSTLTRLASRLTDGAWLHNTTEASIRDESRRTQSARLLVVDEAEQAGENQPERIIPIVTLARHAYDWDGGSYSRGGGGGSGILHANFIFAGINPPPMDDQDKSRFPVLHLQPLPTDPDVVLDFERRLRRVERFGGAIRRRMLDAWHRIAGWHERFRQGLLQAGHKPRGADVFAAFLACGALIKFGDREMPDEFLAQMLARFTPDQLTTAQEFTNPGESCLNRLLTSHTTEWDSGRQELVAEIVAAARDASSKSDMAHTKLRRLGMAWRDVEVAPGIVFAHLAVANEWEALRKIYAGSKWKDGGWKDELKKLAPAVMPGGKKLGVHSSKSAVRFGYGASPGSTQRAAMIPVQIINRYLTAESPDAPPAPPSTGWDGSGSGDPLDWEDGE